MDFIDDPTTKGHMTQYTSGYTSGSHSHPGDKVIYETEGKQLFASNSQSLREYSGNWDLIIDLAGILSVSTWNGPRDFIKKNSAARFRELEQYALPEAPAKVIPSEVLALDWTDMGAPRVNLDFWFRLWEMLPAKTVIACVGGHGRTGTALASLMISDGVDYYSAIASVRAKHCEKAIESTAQEKYLHALYVDFLTRVKANLEPDKIEAIADVETDLKYALENPPKEKVYKSSTVNIGSWVWDQAKGAYVDVVQPSRGVKGELLKGDIYRATGGSPKFVRTGPPAKEDSYMNNRPSKVIGGAIYVKECVDTGCFNEDCRNFSHYEWVEWDFDDEAETNEVYCS